MAQPSKRQWLMIARQRQEDTFEEEKLEEELDGVFTPSCLSLPCVDLCFVAAGPHTNTDFFARETCSTLPVGSVQRS
jgi:hypothetical protein